MATREVQKTRELYQGPSAEKKDILSVVRQSIGTDASDLRDKIFRLYGLAYDSARFVTVDYSKSIVEVYESFVRRYIQQT
jgi:hypothetical protein